jgi:hypothetical protein
MNSKPKGNVIRYLRRKKLILINVSTDKVAGYDVIRSILKYLAFVFAAKINEMSGSATVKKLIKMSFFTTS